MYLCLYNFYCFVVDKSLYVGQVLICENHLYSDIASSLKIVIIITVSKNCFSFFKMLDDLQVSALQKKHCDSKTINITTRTTYYMFCCRNKEWTNPPVMII